MFIADTQNETAHARPQNNRIGLVTNVESELTGIKLSKVNVAFRYLMRVTGNRVV